MDLIQKGITILLKSAVTQQPFKLPEGFELEQAMPLVKKHGMLTLIYEGARICGISTQESLMRQMFVAYCKAMLFSEGQLRDIERIYAVFDREKIDYMPLKGCRMKYLYPRPELRTMGDADILIKVDQYTYIKQLLESMGFEQKHETDHELVWRSKSLYLELHRRLIPSYNEDFYEYYGEGWNLAKVRDGSRYSMIPEDEWIFLFTHFAKHYRDGGIGCRHVTDLWVWQRTHPDVNRIYVEEKLEQLQLREFYDNILRLLKLWFEDGESDSVLDIINEFIFSSGSFGKQEVRMLSRAVRDAKHSISGSRSRCRYLRRILFPGVDVLRGKYTILQKAPWMLPAVWIFRVFYKVSCERKSVNHHTQNLIEMSGENMRLRQKMLNLVGLDYYF